jgi:hypothetical protein
VLCCVVLGYLLCGTEDWVEKEIGLGLPDEGHGVCEVGLGCTANMSDENKRPIDLTFPL